MQVRHHTITISQIHGQLFADLFYVLPIEISSNMNHFELFQQAMKIIQHGRVDRTRALAAAPHQQDRKIAREVEVMDRCPTIPKGEICTEWVSRFIHFFVKEL